MTVPDPTVSMRVAGEGMTHQDRVVGLRAQLAPGLVGHGDLFKDTTCFEHKRPAVGDIHESPITDRIA